MLSLANYVMRGPTQAWISVALLALLTVWLTPLGLLLGAVIGLVTLRVGVADGLKTALIAAFVILSVHQLAMGQVAPGLVALLEFVLPAWVLAWALRQTQALETPIHLAAILIGFALVVFHLMVPDPTQWWQSVMQDYLAPVMQQARSELPQQTLQNLAQLATLLLGMFVMVLWVSLVLLARWWQSALYYPGKFQAAFHQLRLPTSLGMMAALTAVGSLLTQSALVQDLAGVLMVAMMFQGLAILHHAVTLKQLNKAWLIGTYVLLMLFPQVLLIIATIGLVDIWMDIRNRWTQA